MPEAPPKPSPPRLDTVDFILERVADDAAAVARLVGSGEPLWDLEAVRRGYAASAVERA